MASSIRSQVVPADARLDTIFSHFYCVQNPLDARAVPQKLLPTYERLLVVNFGPPIPLSNGQEPSVIELVGILGPLQHMLHYELPPGADLIVVNFTLDGFHRLQTQFLADHPAANDDAASEGLREAFQSVREQIVSLSSADRLAFISDYILLNTAPIGEATHALLESIPYFAESARDPIKVLAENQGVSTRSIQLRFRAHLGYSAKELARFLRFKKLLRQLCQSPGDPVNWMTYVDQFGYHDQSHLIKDFQHFLGLSPRRFLRESARGQVCFSRSGNHY
ncbi:AraC family transcriptional regulator [Spirosoma utsteinense]|uniref:AraC-like DNA-binding protein n=1 Tax=Spirosoma utsteinense TaxID=2585773 RepID=A0ABR6WDJ9_9BACT|nr:helix-turn-helix domain-containing protein [Spirosoma utsteinense]MBC3788676.1 AraC-like DNA-binding protein [Spirosoma utsteinense]MBC3794632.1 AraC-like DNA-binding protein [Spirosoma utsteinense]